MTSEDLKHRAAERTGGGGGGGGGAIYIKRGVNKEKKSRNMDDLENKYGRCDPK